MKFSRTDPKEYTIYCDHPQTVLEAIKSIEKCKGRIKGVDDDQILIQMGKDDRESIVATHFPCSCIKNDELLIISCKSEKVEEARGIKTIYPEDKYSVFFIDTVGGLHTKTKELFKSNIVKQFKYLCVYGEKGMTVAEALKADGRFIPHLGSFSLSDNENPDRRTVCTQKVDNLALKEFKICLPQNKRGSDEYKSNANSSLNTQCIPTPKSIIDVAQQRGVSVKTAVKKAASSDNTEEIYELLRQQFPDLREWMESRFPGDSYQEALNLRKENFGKVQQSFSEVHRVRKLLKLGRSVGKIVTNVCEGTGFVLFDRFILTNAHLFPNCVTDKELDKNVEVSVLFNYEDPVAHTDYLYFTVKKTFVDYDTELDYAILELNPEGYTANPRSKVKNTKVPPGLLKNFGPVPPNGEACIIGHPGGEVKKMDPTFIIEKEKRAEAVKYDPFIIFQISHALSERGIKSIMIGGKNAENIATYNTFMYHGSSGSPVFDALGRVFGLHTTGYVHTFTSQGESVIECAHSLLHIFERLVETLRESNKELLEKVKEEAKENQCLQHILSVEPMECS